MVTAGGGGDSAVDARERPGGDEETAGAGVVYEHELEAFLQDAAIRDGARRGESVDAAAAAGSGGPLRATDTSGY